MNITRITQDQARLKLKALKMTLFDLDGKGEVETSPGMFLLVKLNQSHRTYWIRDEIQIEKPANYEEQMHNYVRQQLMAA